MAALNVNSQQLKAGFINLYYSHRPIACPVYLSLWQVYINCTKPGRGDHIAFQPAQSVNQEAEPILIYE